VLTRFSRAVGGGVVRGPVWDRKRPWNRPTWEWCLVGSSAAEVIDRLWPYLGSVKRAQVERVLATIESNIPREEWLNGQDKETLRSTWDRQNHNTD